jgi:opacity protein-like surface antigen
MRIRTALASAAAVAALAASTPASSAVTATPPTGSGTLIGAAPGLVLPAASIAPGSFTAQQSGSNWTITFSRTLNFSSFEVSNQFPFQAWVELWEQDESDDDFLGRTRASNVSPTTSGTTLTATFRRTSSQLDTELGGEEIYAKALLKNLETGQVFQVATRRIQISP